MKALYLLATLPLLALGQIVTITVTRTSVGTTPTATVTATPVPPSITVTATPVPPSSSAVSTSSGSPPSSSSVPASSPAPPVPTSTPVNTTASYDPVYGNANQSLRVVSCSDGPNGLLSRGFTTFGSLPSFPNIGGAFAITAWNSPACGSCWELAYTNNGTTKKVNILAVDVALNSFNLAPAALNTLTGGRAVELGRVNVVARQVASSVCGL